MVPYTYLRHTITMNILINEIKVITMQFLFLIIEIECYFRMHTCSTFLCFN